MLTVKACRSDNYTSQDPCERGKSGSEDRMRSHKFPQIRPLLYSLEQGKE